MTLAIIDGDVIAYNACENRFQDGSNYKRVSLEQLIEEWTADPAAEETYLQAAWIRFQQLIKDACEICFTEDYKMAVAGEGNFRKDIYPDYKKNRHAPGKRRNPIVPKLRLMAVEAGLATPAHGMEADDWLRIWAEECRAKGEDYVVVSIDKDLLMIPGRHYRIHKSDFTTMSELDSLRFYYEQLLSGDPVDSIPGVPKVGPVKAKQYLAHCDTEEEMQGIVMQTYYSVYGNRWKELQSLVSTCETEQELAVVLTGEPLPISESWEFSKKMLVNCNTEDTFSEILEKHFAIKAPRCRWREELILTGRLIYLRKHIDDYFSIEGWPEVELFDTVEPKPKPKKAKKMEPWTITTALAAIDPASVVGTARWDSAMMFLVEYENLPDDVTAAIEVLTGRNSVPKVEVEAYEVVRKHFVPTILSTPPLSFQRVTDATYKIKTGSITHTYDGIGQPIEIAVDDLVPMEADEQEYGGTKSPGYHKPEVKPKFVMPTIAPIPTFNPNWGKK